eukprot:c12232_g1_i2.p1 GENE.c12232_g1_i2~~c12232_g1_i2.p1  ORF type:complete len:574 (+),score=95.06 c12232_g1_i2:2-1723(+)
MGQIVSCPHGSSGHPHCKCDAPTHAGVLTWIEVKHEYEGSCVECGPGAISNGEICLLSECPALSHPNGVGRCVCDTGYFGKIEWISDAYKGECNECGKGTTSVDGSSCIDVGCPDQSDNFPDCRCVAGTSGELSWSAEKRSYLGACIDCPVGQTSVEGGACAPVACPDHAHEIIRDENFSCECDANHFGVLVWHTELRIYAGSCQSCGKGFSSEAGNARCSLVSCPKHSSGHPNCVCDEGFEGTLEWLADQAHYDGICAPISPSQTPIPSKSSSRTSSRSRSPSRSGTRTSSRSPSGSASPSASPILAPTPCTEIQFTASDSSCHECNGEYFSCGRTIVRELKPRMYCRGFGADAPRLVSSGTNWTLTTKTAGPIFVAHARTNQPPILGWEAVNGDKTPPSFVSACSNVFFRALQLTVKKPLTAQDKEAVQTALAKTTHLTQSQIALSFVQGDLVLFFMDLRLNPGASQEAQSILNDSIEDLSFLIWLHESGIDATNAKFLDALPSEEEHKEEPTPADVEKESGPPVSLTPPRRASRDEHGCVSNSKWCEARQQCLDYRQPCVAVEDDGCDSP